MLNYFRLGTNINRFFLDICIIDIDVSWNVVKIIITLGYNDTIQPGNSEIFACLNFIKNVKI